MTTFHSGSSTAPELAAQPQLVLCRAGRFFGDRVTAFPSATTRPESFWQSAPGPDRVMATKSKSGIPIQMNYSSIRIWWPLGQASVFDLDAPDLLTVWRRNKVAPVQEVPKEAVSNSPCTASRPRMYISSMRRVADRRSAG